jgi:hypothetical protein
VRAFERSAAVAAAAVVDAVVDGGAGAPALVGVGVAAHSPPTVVAVVAAVVEGAAAVDAVHATNGAGV